MLEVINPVPKPIKRGKRYYKIVSCSECGKEFERRTDQINRRSQFNYCTPQCANKANGRRATGRPIPAARKGKEINCKVCGKMVYRSPFRLQRGAKFCSSKCQGVWQQENPVPKGFITGADNRGEKNGRYKHGKRVGGHISKKKLRLKVIERDGGNWCLMCGKPGPGLHLHRVVYGSQCGKYEVSNCVQLCNVHHEVIHSHKSKWQPILLEYIIQATNGNKEWIRRYRIREDDAV